MREINYSEAINEAIREEMRRDSSIILLGQDIGEYGERLGLIKAFLKSLVKIGFEMGLFRKRPQLDRWQSPWSS